LPKISDLIHAPDTVYDAPPMRFFLAVARTVLRVPTEVMVFSETVARYFLPD